MFMKRRNNDLIFHPLYPVLVLLNSPYPRYAKAQLKIIERLKHSSATLDELVKLTGCYNKKGVVKTAFYRLMKPLVEGELIEVKRGKNRVRSYKLNERKVFRPLTYKLNQAKKWLKT